MKHSQDNKTMDWVEDLAGLKYERDFNHGTVYGYNKFKCRCEFCREDKSLSQKRAALKKAVIAQAGAA